jgi:hypothetical protein
MVDVAPQAVTQTEAAAKPSPARYYVLALLTIVMPSTSSTAPLQRPDRADQKGVALSDTMMGLLAGALNDVLKSDFGAQAVRYSLPSTAVTTMLGALLFVVAARWIRGDIKRAA